MTEFVLKFIRFSWSLRRQFVKYFIVGISGLLLNLLLLMFGKEVLKISATITQAVAGALLIVYNFSLNKYWSFREKSMPHRQFVRYMFLTGFNYLFSLGAMYVLHERLGFDYRLINICTVATMVTWNFALFKYWVYK